MTGFFTRIPNPVFNISALAFLSEMEIKQNISDLWFFKNLPKILKMNSK